MRTVARQVLAVLACAALAGCALSPFHRFESVPESVEPVTEGRTYSTQASDDCTDAAADGMFVGVAFAGGGSRAAVFGGEVLCLLHEMGVMQRADFVSGISMGAVAGASYCLSRDEGDAMPDDLVWRRADVQERMRRGVWLDYFIQYLTNPLNVLRYYATGLHRSYQMRRILDRTYFHDRTLADLNPRRPKLLVTATVLETGAVFTFTDRQLTELGIRPDVLRVADAVQASASFPGVFHPYVLPRYEPGESGPRIVEFIHLVDGGVYDNLGVAPLLRIYRENRSRFPRGGVIVVADASLPVEVKAALAHRTDVRAMTDYLLDFGSMLQSLEIMFEVDRLGLMRALREDSFHLGLRVVHLHYATGLLADAGEGRAALPNILDLDDAVPTNVDFGGRAHLVAPTALGISEEHAQATREAARRAVELRRAELVEIAEGR